MPQRSHAAALKKEDEQYVGGRDDGAPYERYAKEQVERDGAPDHLGDIAGDDRQLTQNPETERYRGRVARAAGLREIEAACDTELRTEPLQKNRKQVREHEDP